MLSSLLLAARRSVPDDVAALVAERGQALGAHNVTVYLVDQEQYWLVPLPQHAGGEREPLSIESTLAGRCFRRVAVQQADGGRQVWVPLLNGLERLGVLHLEFPADTDSADTGRAAGEQVNEFAALITELIMVKSAYGDLFARVRQRRPLSLAAQIAWNLLPPLTFGTDRLVISSVLAPAYDVGGDSFDYAVDATAARFAVFDAMGHGIGAGWLATIAIGAYRNARLRELDLPATVAAVDTAVADTFGGEQFVTALFAELDLATGQLRWHSAGHPAPLLLRGARVVKTLHSDPGLPLGLGATWGATRTYGQESLEPGDRVLLFTDGVVEARSADGEFFGVDRLADFLAREAASGHPPSEMLRRLVRAILEHQKSELQDDATCLLLEWVTGRQRAFDLGAEVS